VLEPHAVGIAVDDIGALVALSLSAPKSNGFKTIAMTRLTKIGNLFGVGLSFMYSVSSLLRNTLPRLASNDLLN
jgi:hypothetical protein